MVASGAFKGSILVLTLLNIFINDLNSGVESAIMPNADDTELGGAIDSLEGWETLQSDLDRLEHCEVISGMKFKKSKCRILHLEYGNARHNYKLGEKWLKSSPEERDLGMPVDNRLNTSLAVYPGSRKGKPHSRVHQT